MDKLTEIAEIINNMGAQGAQAFTWYLVYAFADTVMVSVAVLAVVIVFAKMIRHLMGRSMDLSSCSKCRYHYSGYTVGSERKEHRDKIGCTKP